MKTWKMLPVLCLLTLTITNTLHAQPPRSRRQPSPPQQRLQPRPPAGGFPKYDLMMAALSRTGQVISMTVRNQGPLATPASRVYVQAVDIQTGKVVRGKFARVAALQPNKSMRIRLHNFCEVRSAKIYATVDPYNELTEANEGNNSRVIVVKDVVLARPDLSIVSIRAPANSNRIVVRVQNTGKGKLSQGTAIEVKTMFGLKQHERLRARISALQLRQSVNVVVRPRQRLLSTMVIEAKVDPNNVIAETNEANNRRAVSYPTR